MTKNSLYGRVPRMRLRAAAAAALRRGRGRRPDTNRIPTQLRITIAEFNWVRDRARSAHCALRRRRAVGSAEGRIAMCVKARRGEGAGSIAGCRAVRAEVGGAADLTRTMSTVNLIVVKFVNDPVRGRSVRVLCGCACAPRDREAWAWPAAVSDERPFEHASLRGPRGTVS